MVDVLRDGVTARWLVASVMICDGVMVVTV